MTVPRHYSLSLDLDRGARIFSGRVVIDIEAAGNEPVVLDCAGLEIVSASPAVLAQTEATLTLDGGASRIEISFRGRMSSSARGLYAGDGFCVTQMQPSYARGVFPCFDDPRFKTTFDIAVTSGTDVVITNGGTGALMPPHLVLIAAGEFRVAETPSDAVRLRMFSLDDPERYRAAMEAARAALSHHAAFLGCAYPWPRLDIVAIPTFEADAIESTSAIVFRSDAITGASPERIATLVAHEVAHQWLGSLVTPATWSDLWLSEGSATWLAARSTGGETALVREIRVAMGADSSAAARPLLTGAADAMELFDALTYAKGAAILRLLEEHSGADAFRNAMREFVQRHANGAVTTDDLFQSLRDSGLDPAIAAPFLETAGVPQLAFDWSGNTVRVTRHDRHNRVVPASLRIGLEDGTVMTHRELLRDDVTQITLPSPVRRAFGNASAAGYYRCTYARWSSIPCEELTANEKTAFLSDLYDAVWSAQSDTLVLLRVLESLAADTDTKDLRDEIEQQIVSLLAPPGAAPATARVEELATVTGAARIAKCEELLADPSTRRTAWSYLKQHWNELQHDLVSFGGRGAIPALAAVSEPDLRNDIAMFFAQHPPRGAERALQHTLQQIDARIRFREREQRKYHSRLSWSQAGRPAATQQMRAAHSLLNMLTGALTGALLTRSLFDQLRIPAPEWMHTSADIAAALAPLEQRFLRVFAGEAMVDEALLRVAAGAREELNAPATIAEDAPPINLAILAAREAASREHVLGGMIAFSDLFDGEERTKGWREAQPATEQALMVARVNVIRVVRGDVDDGLQTSLARAALLLPGMLRAQAVDLAGIDAGFRGDRSFDHAAATWAAFGYNADEAGALRRAGFTHPAQARLAADRR